MNLNDLFYNSLLALTSCSLQRVNGALQLIRSWLCKTKVKKNSQNTNSKLFKKTSRTPHPKPKVAGGSLHVMLYLSALFALKKKTSFTHPKQRATLTVGGTGAICCCTCKCWSTPQSNAANAKTQAPNRMCRSAAADDDDGDERQKWRKCHECSTRKQIAPTRVDNIRRSLVDGRGVCCGGAEPNGGCN